MASHRVTFAILWADRVCVPAQARWSTDDTIGEPGGGAIAGVINILLTTPLWGVKQCSPQRTRGIKDGQVRPA